MTFDNNFFVKVMAAIGFYAVAISLIQLLDKYSPGDMCNPGLGMLAFIFFIPVSVITFLVSLVKSIRRKNSNFLITIIHFFGIFAPFVLLK